MRTTTLNDRAQRALARQRMSLVMQHAMEHTHKFKPLDESLPTQCCWCFGWYDDPRHLVPLPGV